MIDDAARRSNLVETQLRPSNVTEPRVLDAFATVPRPPFLPAHLKAVAYSDDDIDLGDGRFLIEPLVLARLLELANPESTSTALVVGCETGYAAVVCARLAATVFAVVEPDRVVEVEARATDLDAENVLAVGAETALDGHPAKAPYDVIVVAGRVAAVPPALVDQLAEGGRMVVVVGDARVGRGTLVTRVHGHVGQRTAFDAATRAVRAPEPRPVFQF